MAPAVQGFWLKLACYRLRPRMQRCGAGSFYRHLSRKSLGVLCNGVDGQPYYFLGEMGTSDHAFNLRFQKQLAGHRQYSARENGGRLYETMRSRRVSALTCGVAALNRRLSRLMTGFPGDFEATAPCASPWPGQPLLQAQRTAARARIVDAQAFPPYNRG